MTPHPIMSHYKAAVFFQLRLSDDRFLSIPTIPLDKIPMKRKVQLELLSSSEYFITAVPWGAYDAVVMLQQCSWFD